MRRVGLIVPNYYEANDKETYQPIENPNAAYPSSVSPPIFTGETVSTEVPMHLMPPKPERFGDAGLLIIVETNFHDDHHGTVSPNPRTT
jgi:hypothetical protein